MSDIAKGVKCCSQYHQDHTKWKVLPSQEVGWESRSLDREVTTKEHILRFIFMMILLDGYT